MKKGNIWLVATIAPLLVILLSYIFDAWSWGLMDDTIILSSGTHILDRTTNYFEALRIFGHFNFFFALHSGLFYSIFENHPSYFYIFKLAEITCILFIWGLLAYRITRERIAIFLVPVITLSFHYFYDTFFYLSSHEHIGLLFLGLALHAIWKSIQSLFEPEKKASSQWMWFVIGLILLIFSFSSKETFSATGVGISLSLAYLFFRLRKSKLPNTNLLLKALIVLCVSVGFAVSLKYFVQSGYTASYSFLDLHRLKSSLINWFRKDFSNHVPWILISIYVLSTSLKGKLNMRFSNQERWGIVLMGLIYLGYTAILLPWNTLSYYASPLGLFLAMIVTILIANRLKSLDSSVQFYLIILSLTMNLTVSQYALSRERTYQYDTHNLIHWIGNNRALKKDPQNWDIRSNAMEAATVLPRLVNKIYSANFKKFTWSLNTEQPGSLPIIYVYSPRFHSIAQNALQNKKMLFYSKNWVVYGD